MDLPPALVQTATHLYGAPGVVWLERLPHVIAELCETWSLEPAGFLESRYNLVLRVHSAVYGPAVLKVGCPGQGIEREIEALRCFSGFGSVRVLDSDFDRAAVLLEWIEPGTTLAEMFSEGKDDGATEIAAGVFRRLRECPNRPSNPPHILDWREDMVAALNRGVPFDSDTLESAIEVYADLSASAEREVLLHGDLHHYNILSAGEGRYVAVDPKGIVGDPAYEVGPLLKNPIEHLKKISTDVEMAHRRIAILSEVLGYDTERIRLWGFCQAVLSAVWTLDEDPDDWHEEIALARTLLAAK